MTFEIVKDKHRKFPNSYISIPNRGSRYSAGYDFKSVENKTLSPGETYIFWTDLKVKISKLAFMLLVVRSSVGIKKKLRLANTIGIIDSDYYGNEDNDGNIGICLYNYGSREVEINKGDRIAQGIIMPYISLEPLEELQERKGGIGSTGD